MHGGPLWDFEVARGETPTSLFSAQSEDEDDPFYDADDPDERTYALAVQRFEHDLRANERRVADCLSKLPTSWRHLRFLMAD